MKLLFYTDLHRGLVRKANFTSASSAAREELYGGELSALLDLRGIEFDAAVCLGDFFDRHSNSEAVILQAAELAGKTWLILAGNHDVQNRSDSVSSLDLIDELLPGKVVKKLVVTDMGGGAYLVMVPHQMTQEAFLAELEAAEAVAEGCPGLRVLCLHCNYAAPFVNDTVALNLTRERAEQLLEHFHFVLLGHEHTPREDFEGRLKVIGSVFPTAYDNLGRHRVLLLDTATFQFADWTTWDPADHLFAGTSSAAKSLDGVSQYYDLEDDLGRGEAQRLAVSLFAQGALGVRISYPLYEGTAEKLQLQRIEHLPQMIERDLEKNRSDLLPIWREMANA